MNKLDLSQVPAKYIKVNSYPEKGLQIVKYSKRAFFDQAWKDYPILKDCRGIITDMELNILAKPFVKVLNLGEDGTELPTLPFIMVRKVNGFMGMVSYLHNKLVLSTTGSLDSPFVDLFDKEIDKQPETLRAKLAEVAEKYSLDLMFEVVSPEDPHIIPEKPGLYLIGARTKSGTYLRERELDSLAVYIGSGLKRPRWSLVESKEDFNEKILSCNHEGYMIRAEYDPTYTKTVKVKSPYYLNRKFLARCGVNKTKAIWSASVEELFTMGLEEEFIGVVVELQRKFKVEEWVNLKDQERLDIINKIYMVLNTI